LFCLCRSYSLTTQLRTWDSLNYKSLAVVVYRFSTGACHAREWSSTLRQGDFFLSSTGLRSPRKLVGKWSGLLLRWAPAIRTRARFNSPFWQNAYEILRLATGQKMMTWNIWLTIIKPARYSVELKVDLCKWNIFEGAFGALLEIGLWWLL